MDSSSRQRARNISFEVAALPASEQEAAILRLCASNVEILAEVRAILDANASGLSDSATIADARSADTLLQTPIEERPGSRIGSYKLLAPIGEGGFGSVFMAEQERPVQRKVALKIIKLGMDTRQVVARFEQERQALALMDHPNIAKVFDAGATDAGRPYFVMELCKGEPITDYCDRNGLSIRQRLELFAQVCSAVQHAHTKGLIHRDIKPSNVLASTQDGHPQTKVIDFGIAKATASKLTEKTLFTGFSQMIGTPEYMSPEQAEGSFDIDTRTDVYALGVLLYELLTGVTPFDPKRLRSAAYAEIQRIIREVDPPKPSTRLSENTDTVASIAAQRRVEPKKLGSLIRGELDWIVMKALEKDRSRRYETANGLAMDVQRYLAGEAVVAAPPSQAYRIRKFITRNKGPVIAAGLLAIALIGGLIGTSYGLRQAVKARQAEALQRKTAEAQRDKAAIIAKFMSEMLGGALPSVALGRDITMLREMMHSAAARIDGGELKTAPEAELRLRNTLGNTYTHLALYDDAARMLEPSVPMARSLYPADHEDLASTLDAVAYLFQSRGDKAAAEPLFRESVAMFRRLYPGDNAELAATLNDTAVLLNSLGNVTEAEPLYREALAMRRRLFPGDHRDVAVSLNSLSDLLKARGDVAEAERLLRESLAMQRRLFPGDHPDLAVDLQNLATMLRENGNVAEAEPLCRESLEMMKRLYKGDHPNTAAALRNMARILRDRGDPAGAEAVTRESLVMARRLFPADNPTVALDIQNLAILVQARGDLVGAEPMFRESLDMNRRLNPGDHANTFACLNNLAFVLLARGDAADAEPLAREAVGMSERLAGKDAFVTGNARMRLGIALTALVRFGEAEAELIEAERVLTTAKGVPAARRKQCVEALLSLYESWNSADPGKGHAVSAAQWKAKLAATSPPPTQPATTSRPTPKT